MHCEGRERGGGEEGVGICGMPPRLLPVCHGAQAGRTAKRPLCRYAQAFKQPLQPPLSKLSSWMRPSLQGDTGGRFGPAFARLARFYKAMAVG